MHFRCVECLSAVWVERVAPVRASEALACTTCGARYAARPREELGATLGEQFRNTTLLAKRRALDLASAYSYLLGILSDEELRLLQGSSGEPTEQPADPGEIGEAAPAPSALAEFDPDFAPAIEQGHLSVREAIRRGDREAYATALAGRHGLSHEAALQVADNRTTLRRALAGKAARVGRTSPSSLSRGVSRGQQAIAVLVTLGALGLFGWRMWQQTFEAPSRTSVRAATPAVGQTLDEGGSEPERRPGGPRERALVVTDVRRDDSGEIVEILGPDPATVLRAYCAELGRSGLEPVEITETVPRLGDARLGVFRDYRELQSDSAIWMRKDRRTGRWIAGDGTNRIPVRRAPQLPPGAYRRPVKPLDETSG